MTYPYSSAFGHQKLMGKGPVRDVDQTYSQMEMAGVRKSHAITKLFETYLKEKKMYNT